MRSEEFQQQVTMANAFKDNGDFKEAEKAYRMALKNSAPEDMQQLIESIRAMKEKAISIPKKDSKAQKLAETGFKLYETTFKDVIGYKGQKRVIMRNLEFVKGKEEDYLQLNIGRSTGFLLYGPPGTGKTFMTKGISGEMQIPMKDVIISEILGKYVGESEKAIKKVFDDAKTCQPSIIFFDEMDALASSRENANDFTSGDIKNMVNEFMKQLSELHDDKTKTVFIIGATNLPWLVDPAILRSGRIEHKIFFGPPNFWDRRKIFKYYMNLEGSKYTLKANLSLLALATMRYSPADLEKVCTITKKRCIKNEKYTITTRDIQNVLKDKNEGVSSLDAWVLQAKQQYLKKSKMVVRHTGFLGLKKEKEKIDEQGKMSEAELKNYRPLVNFIKSQMRWWTISNIIRRMAKGI